MSFDVPPYCIHRNTNVQLTSGVRIYRIGDWISEISREGGRGKKRLGSDEVRCIPGKTIANHITTLHRQSVSFREICRSSQCLRGWDWDLPSQFYETRHFSLQEAESETTNFQQGGERLKHPHHRTHSNTYIGLFYYCCLVSRVKKSSHVAVRMVQQAGRREVFDCTKEYTEVYCMPC